MGRLTRKKSGEVGGDEKVVNVECNHTSLYKSMISNFLINFFKLEMGKVAHIFILSTQETGGSL